MVVMLVVAMVAVVWIITSRNAGDARKTGFAYADEVARRNAAQVQQVVLGGLSTARDMAQVMDQSRPPGPATWARASRWWPAR